MSSLYQLPDIKIPQFKKPEKNLVSGRGWHLIVLVILVSFLGGGMGGIVAEKYLLNGETRLIQSQNGLILPQDNQTISQEQQVINAVKGASPAVVSIIISKDIPVMEQYYTDPFEDFFGNLFPNLQVPQYRQNGTEKKEIGGGTGFIISSDGLVLTNKHVVSDKEAEYTVLTNDGKKYPAKVLALDPNQDLAVIKITQEDLSLPILNFGDSDSLQIGQTVITIGNALGEYRNTVSVGVISGLSRTITASGGGISETIEGVIQTDAAINSGNSGGPLLNLNGEVVGINTAIVSGAQNIGFAIPINNAKNDIESVKNTGKIIYPFLGVRYMSVNKDIQEKYNLQVDYGAWIQKGENGESAISSGSAAESAGLKEGDIILEFDGQKITIDDTLSEAIMKHKPGDKISLKILRDKKELVVEATLGERQE